MKPDYQSIKTFAKAKGRRVDDLIVLAKQNDPFYCGAPADVAKAKWFADLWKRFRFQQGVHLRRIHYQLISQEDPILDVNGKPYSNTDKCWNLLSEASKYARHLGYVAADAFTDRRNPPPKNQIEYDAIAQPGICFSELGDWELPQLNTNLANALDFELPEPWASGYSYGAIDQPVHLELWAEKSTMDDELLPVCQQYQCNLVTSLGFQSITSAIRLLERTARLVDLAGEDRPVRIFYVSDFDPAGVSMPVSVARQIEYWISYYAPGADIALKPLVMTRDQVIQYQLPRTPVKESDRRKDNFEDRYGEGAVELDALEALHPGELAQVVGEALAVYRNTDIETDLEQTDTEADEIVTAAWEAEAADLAELLADAKTRAEQVYDRYRQRVEQLGDDLAADLEPIQDELDELRDAVLARKEAFDCELPERPRAALQWPDESDWLFHSRRSYFEQLAAYKDAQAANDD